MTISFCFTLKLNNSIDYLGIYQIMISKALECAKLYHKVIFYTDSETIPHLNISVDDIRLIDTTNFYFLDDFKIHLLSIISDDEVLVDTDLFLFRKLKLEEGFDIYTDWEDSSKNEWYSNHLNWFLDNGINTIIPEFGNKIISTPNIGILKIVNNELKKEYISLYYKIRDWALCKNNTITKGLSVILGQYLLGLLIENYKVGYCSSMKNNYIHLSGPKKFEKNILNTIIPKKII
jgi:hypothetical protein